MGLGSQREQTDRRGCTVHVGRSILLAKEQQKILLLATRLSLPRLGICLPDDTARACPAGALSVGRCPLQHPQSMPLSRMHSTALPARNLQLQVLRPLKNHTGRAGPRSTPAGAPKAPQAHSQGISNLCDPVSIPAVAAHD